MCKHKVTSTRPYSLVGDIYEYYGQDLASSTRTHTDVGWRLRTKKYGATATFSKFELSEDILSRPCALLEKKAGIYVLKDDIFPHGFYIGKGRCIHDRLWKHAVKLSGTEKWVQAVQSTKEFTKYRRLREAKGYKDLSDVKVVFFFTDKIDELEDQLLGAYTAKYNTTPFCNATEEAMFEPWDI